MSESKYYDGTKILSMKDLNGETPELFMITTNRTGGKTTYFNRWCVNRFKKDDEKFMLLYRYSYELGSVADKFFKDINTLFFPKDVMTAKVVDKGAYVELFLNKVPCGYAAAINNADQVKKHSHVFSDVQRILMDEFQSETNHYCSGEVTKFLSIHKSVARGQGQQYRYVPVIMLSNPVSIINPYYTELGISARLRDDTKFLRGNGFILEQGYNEGASEASKLSGITRAFSSNKYTAYANEAIYLNDNKAFIERPHGKCMYICTLRYKGKDYGVKEYADAGVIYCDDRPDITHTVKISVTTDDHNINYVMLKKNDFMLSNLRFFFEKGCFRFKNLHCKEAVLSALSY